MRSLEEKIVSLRKYQNFLSILEKINPTSFGVPWIEYQIKREQKAIQKHLRQINIDKLLNEGNL